jgi:hypothetical protein
VPPVIIPVSAITTALTLTVASVIVSGAVIVSSTAMVVIATTAATTSAVIIVARVTTIIRPRVIRTLKVTTLGRSIIPAWSRCPCSTPTGLFNVHNFAHEIGGIESSNGSVGLLS